MIVTCSRNGICSICMYDFYNDEKQPQHSLYQLKLFAMMVNQFDTLLVVVFSETLAIGLMNELKFVASYAPDIGKRNLAPYSLIVTTQFVFFLGLINKLIIYCTMDVIISVSNLLAKKIGKNESFSRVNQFMNFFRYFVY